VYKRQAHAVAPKSYAVAGGYDIFTNLTAGVMFIFGFIMAAALGCTAGSIDLTEGMFRHLVVTGRSRVALYFARIPAGLAIVCLLYTSTASQSTSLQSTTSSQQRPSPIATRTAKPCPSSLTFRSESIRSDTSSMTPMSHSRYKTISIAVSSRKFRRPRTKSRHLSLIHI